MFRNSFLFPLTFLLSMFNQYHIFLKLPHLFQNKHFLAPIDLYCVDMLLYPLKQNDPIPPQKKF